MLVVNIDVPDVERATAFYCSAFRLEVGRRFGGGVVELVGGPVNLYLLEKDADTDATATGRTRSYARHWTPVHLDFLVHDIIEAKARALAAGATLEVDTKSNPWGKIAMFSDPWGHGFCLIEFVGRGYDEIAE